MSQSKYDSYDYMFKIVVVGESGVGKTNLISRFTKNQFTSDTASTIGVEFTSKIVPIEGKLIKAQLWDTAGQERYQAVATAYYRNGLGGLLVFDLSKRTSFDNLERWYKNMQDYMPNAKIILIGNKSDLENKREISQEEANKYADDHGMKYVETSALNSFCVEDAFVKLLKEVYEKQATIGFQSKSTANTYTLNPANDSKNNNTTKSGIFSCCNK